MKFMPDSDSEDELPPGWKEQINHDGRVCYVNRFDKLTQYTHPRTGRTKRVAYELPVNWEQLTENSTNRTVFYNKVTNNYSCVDPRLAFAVEEPSFKTSQVRQRFDASSNAFQVLHGMDLNGKIALITGANCGLGLETARSLAFHGCEIIFACRNRDATIKAINNINSAQKMTQNQCKFMELDLASFASTYKFINRVKENYTHIDYLILNAGVFGMNYVLTENNLETTFQVCHLSHFFLTLELETLFNRSSRIIILSSESHRYANLTENNISLQHLSPSKDKYWNMMAYNNAKLCNLLFGKELADRWMDRKISVFLVHPGNMISTKIQRNWWLYRVIFAFARPFTKSVQQGAATTVYCATADELHGLTGYYFNNCYFSEPSKLVENKALRQTLWEISEKLVENLKCNVKRN